MSSHNKGPSPFLGSSPNFSKFTSFASDIDLKTQTKRPERIPRMIWWNSGNLNVECENGDVILLGSEIAAQKWEMSPAKILNASTTATIAYVWW